MEDKVKSLIDYVQSEGRVCPMPKLWHDMWDMLPDRMQKTSGGWEPPAVNSWIWRHTTAKEKSQRLKQHIEYAADEGVLDKVDKFLRELKPDQWAYDDKTRSRTNGG